MTASIRTEVSLACQVMGVVRSELEILLQLAGIGIESQNTFGIEVVPRSIGARKVRPWIARRPVEQVQIRMVRTLVHFGAPPRLSAFCAKGLCPGCDLAAVGA